MLHCDSVLTRSPTSTVTIGGKDSNNCIMDKFTVSLKSEQQTDTDEEDHESAKESIDKSTSPTNTNTGSKRKFRIIDETLLSEEEARKLELRRAYNRDCASRARIRTKSLVQELQEQVRSLKDEKEDLRQSNAKLQACLAFSEKQNRELLANRSLSEGRSLSSVAFGTGDLALLRPTLQQGIGMGNNNLGAATNLAYITEQSRQLRYLPQNQWLQQQSSASSLPGANSSTLFTIPMSTAMNNTALSNDELNLREHLLNMNSQSNSSDLLEALIRMRQGYNDNTGNTKNQQF